MSGAQTKRLLQYPCPKCKSSYSPEDVSLSLEKRPGRKRKYYLPPTKKVILNYGKISEERNISIERTRNPYKVYTIFEGHTKGREHPIINPNSPSSEPQEGKPTFNAWQSVIENFNAISRHCFIVSTMVDQISGRYPYNDSPYSLVWNWIRNNKFVDSSMAFTEVIRSGFDYRYQRSWAQWMQIIDYADERTVMEASKKFYGITPEGKKIYLSKRAIKHKREEAIKLLKNLEYLPKLFLALNTIGRVISNDPELTQEYERLSKEYDKKEGNEISQYVYLYYKIRHKKRNSKPYGRVEHHVKESDLPAELIPYVKSKYSHLFSKSS